MESVKGKVVLITGGAGGIGLSMTKKLLDCGAKGVSIVDISKVADSKTIEELISLFGDDKVTFIKADVPIKEEFKAAFETTIQKYKQLDIVVNNAGIVNEIDWKKTLAVNLGAVIQGSYLAMLEYLPKYKTESEGVIVNMASILGLEAIHAPIYCATKHGVVGLGRALGSEEFYKKYKVRVLTLCPGVIDTPFAKTTTEQTVFFLDRAVKDLKLLSPVVQSAERVAEALIYVITNGKTGSLWVTEEEKPFYEVVVPHRSSMKV